MKDIGSRIAQVISAVGMTQTKFARELALQQSYVSQLCAGIRQPSDRTIKDICRVFGVSESWLRTGDGDMFAPLNRDVQLAEFFGDVLSGETPDFRRRFLSALSKLGTDEWALLEKIIVTMAEEIKKD